MQKNISLRIKEPLDDVNNHIEKSKIGLIIVPGVCFDKNNNRIGFGKGYYDKFLSNSENIFKIGICFSEQFLNNDIINANKNDVKMDMIITDKC